MGRKNIPNQISVIYTKNYCDLLEDKVFLDIINTVIHQKCYYQSSYYLMPKKDEGTFKKILFKYPFFIDD